MKTANVMAQPQRRDRQIRERVHDPYRLRDKPPGTATCPQCGVSYAKGRWQWLAAPEDGAAVHLCPACQRERDHLPAGFVTIEGWFVGPHKEEIIGLVRRCAEQESALHPLNRIMELREEGMHLEVTTTDIHLPRRIGEALANAYDGNLSFRYRDGEYHMQVTWRRDD